jgi:hypothetical protein
MERWCFVEAKTFIFLVVEGASVVRVEERRRSFSRLVFLGACSLVWLVSTMENLLRFSGDKEFVKSFREGSKVLIVRRGSNPASRYFELAVYAVGGRRGIILILEGRGGRGWSRFAAELGKVIAFFEASAGSGIVPPPLVLKGSGNLVEPELVQSHFLAGGTGFVGKKVSFAEVLCSSVSTFETEKTMGKDCFSQVEKSTGKDHYVGEHVKGLS